MFLFVEFAFNLACTCLCAKLVHIANLLPVKFNFVLVLHAKLIHQAHVSPEKYLFWWLHIPNVDLWITHVHACINYIREIQITYRTTIMSIKYFVLSDAFYCTVIPTYVDLNFLRILILQKNSNWFQAIMQWRTSSVKRDWKL